MVNMKALKTNIALVAGLLSLAVSLTLFLESQSQDGIAYVRSSELVYGYIGMKEAHNRYKEKAEIWQANVDTLQHDYQISMKRYTNQIASLSEAERKEGQRILMLQQENLLNYSKAINQKAKEEDEKITGAVLNQINSFVEEYGREHGYEVILGTTSAGNLLYGDEAIDITEEVLADLNRIYTGES